MARLNAAIFTLLACAGMISFSPHILELKTFLDDLWLVDLVTLIKKNHDDLYAVQMWCYRLHHWDGGLVRAGATIDIVIA